MTTYYTNKNRSEIHYRTTPCSTRLQVRYSEIGEWQWSTRCTDRLHTMAGLVEVPMTSVSLVPVAKIHKAFKTFFCVLLTLVVTLVVVVSTNPIN
jgi:hypothetical protein